jgi:hypothetical protein
MSNQIAPPQANASDVSVASGPMTVVMVDALRGTKPWVLLIGILLFVGAVFSVIGGLGVMASSAMMGAARGGAPAAMFVGMGAMYLVVAVVYVFLGMYLVKYSSAIGRLVSGGQSGDMEDALRQQRKFWKLAGILILIMMVFAVLGIFAAIAIPLLAR